MGNMIADGVKGDYFGLSRHIHVIKSSWKLIERDRRKQEGDVTREEKHNEKQC
jgi:hypothetical protein